MGLTITGYNVKLSVDSFSWSKPGLAVSNPVTQSPPTQLGRAINTEFFQEPLISNTYQAKQANLAKLEILQFRHKEYNIVTEGTVDIPFGAFFYLENKKKRTAKKAVLDEKIVGQSE